MGYGRKVKDRLKVYVKDPLGCDLLDQLLKLDPKVRIDADSALNHEFFYADPMPCDLSKMLSKHLQSMFEYLAQQRRRNRHQPTTTNQVQNRAQDNTYHDRVY